MNHEKVTIASILKILQIDSTVRNLKLDHDMKNDHLGSLSIRSWTLKLSASF